METWITVNFEVNKKLKTPKCDVELQRTVNLVYDGLRS